MQSTLMFGNRKVGGGECPLFLPDIGTFFNQDVALATHMVAQLADMGVEAIKGEILHDERIALDVDYEVRYFGEKEGFKSERYRDLIRRKVVSFEDYERIFSQATQSRLPVVLSVYDFEGADFANQIGACALKIASSNLTHYPLMDYLSTLKLPLILDTGRATLGEIAQGVDRLRQKGVDQLLIEHSPKAPPAPVSEQNIKFIKTLANTFHTPVGLSDHHAGTEMLMAATVMGASLLEKGLCEDNAALDQDVTHALPLGKVSEVLQQIELYHSALGSGMKEAEIERHPARMGLVAKTALKKGDVLTLDNVFFAFPAVGISVINWDEVAGQCLSSDLPEGQPIQWFNLMPATR